jgi:hypothetical protein
VAHPLSQLESGMGGTCRTHASTPARPPGCCLWLLIGAQRSELLPAELGKWVSLGIGCGLGQDPSQS